MLYTPRLIPGLFKMMVFGKLNISSGNAFPFIYRRGLPSRESLIVAKGALSAVEPQESNRRTQLDSPL
jgi:hypothetical protein